MSEEIQDVQDQTQGGGKNKNRLTRAQKRERRKVKRALRIARFRKLKNLFWWFTGVVSSVAIVAGGIFVGAKYVPIKTFTGDDTNKYVSDEIADQSLIDTFLKLNQYGLGDLPVVSELIDNLLESSGFSAYVSVDKEKLKTVKFSYSAEEGKTFASELQSCIKIVATIETVGGSEVIGDIGKITAFKEWEPITEYSEKYLTTDENGIAPGEDVEPSDYYYYDTESGEYEPAFNDDGTWGKAGKQSPLYTQNPDIPQTDSEGNLIKGEDGEFLNNPDLYYYLEESGGVSAMSADTEEPETPDGPSAPVHADSEYKRVFDQDGVRLAPEGVKMYYAKLSAVPFPEAMGMLSESMGRLGVIDMIETCGSTITEGTFLYKILNGKKANELGSIDSDDIKLIDIFDNPDALDMITNALNERRRGDPENFPDYQEVESKDVTVKDLNDFDADYIKLTDVLPYCERDEEGNIIGKDNRKTYQILIDAMGDSEKVVWELKFKNNEEHDKTLEGYANELTVSALSSFNIDNVHLKTVVEETDENKTMFDILVQATYDYDEENPEYDINDADDFETLKNELKISALSNFNSKKIKLATVRTLPKDEGGEKSKDTLTCILEEATGKDYNKIQIEDLEGDNFNIDNVKLSTVVTENTGNKILEKLRLDKSVNLGNIGEKINALTLYEVYGENCFTTNEEDAIEGSPKYKFVDDKDGKGYVMDDEEGTYYIHKNNGIWLILCFDGDEFIEDENNDNYGRPKTYKVSTSNIGTLENEPTTISSKFTNATIRELVDAGILSAANSKLYNYTLSKAIEKLGELMP